jgi:proteasome lid subunit RPN8/RPN11
VFVASSVHAEADWLYVAKERMIGWYHTGPKLRASDQEINDLFKRFIARPVMVIVDVRQQNVGIPTDAYFAVEEIKDVRARSTVWANLQS